MPASLYKASHVFTPDQNATVWRYMNLEKYIDLISRKELWFSDVKALQQADPYEGAFTDYDYKKIRDVFLAPSKQKLREIFESYQESDFVFMIDISPEERSHNWFKVSFFVHSFSSFNHVTQRYTLSCWHENLSESDAMWAIHAKREAGVVIKSTIPRLLSAFKNSDSDVIIGKVGYRQGTVMDGKFFTPLLVKRPAFQHEKEIRLIAELPSKNSDRSINVQQPSGQYITCNIENLIEEVIISPLMLPYGVDAIKKVTKEYLPNISISQSRLLTKRIDTFPMSKELKIMIDEVIKNGLIKEYKEIVCSQKKTEST